MPEVSTKDKNDSVPLANRLCAQEASTAGQRQSGSNVLSEHTYYKKKSFKNHNFEAHPPPFSQQAPLF